jgi:hypothetical protein
MEFSKPSVFYYLFLLAIPLIIHLFNFRKHKKIFFSNIYFLREIQTKSQSQNKIKQWLLLLNRMLIVSMIITAFAMPFFKKTHNIQEASKIGLYIDNSFSMSKIDENNTSLIDYAKNNAKEIINTLTDAQKILIITNDFERKHQKWYSPKEVISLIDSIKISGNPNQLNTVLAKYSQNIDSNSVNHLYLLSDFQKQIPVQLPNFSKNLSIKIGLLENSYNDSNLSIDSCYLSTPFRKKNEIENLNIVIQNHGSEDIITNAELFINNQKKSTHSIEVPAKSTIIKTINYVNPMNTATIHGKIIIDDSLIQFDNQIFFTYKTDNQIPVLNIYEDTTSHYLTNLFSDSIFDFKTYNINQIEYSLFDNFNLIILDELKNIPNSLASRLKQYVSGGNSIFIFPNQNTEIQSYNQFFQTVNVDFLNKWIQSDRAIELINYQHPLFQSVFSKKVNNINLPKIQGSFLVKKNISSQNRDILNFSDQSPFLAEYLFQSGHIFLTLSDLSIHNSNFPEHALFVPCLYNATLLNNQKNIYTTIESENIIELNSMNTNDIIRLQKERELDVIGDVISPSLVRFSNLISKDGHYKLIINNTDHKSISFNYNRRESTTNYWKKKEIQNIFLNQDIDFLRIKNNLIPINYKENNQKNNTSLFFITLAIIFLIIELILLRIWKI